MDAILECYHENIHPDKDVYYFFDEIQYAADWPGWLKIIYDTQPESKVIATGSASPALVKGSTESGAGRWSVIQVPTLSFYEYCSLIGISITNLPENLLLPIRQWQLLWHLYLPLGQKDGLPSCISMEPKVPDYILQYLPNLLYSV